MSDGDTLSQKWLSKRIQLTFESHFCEYDVCDFSVTFRFCSFLANFSRIWFCISSRLVLPIIYSEKIMLSRASAGLRRAIKKVEYFRTAERPLLYDRLDELLDPLTVKEKQQLTDFIIRKYSCIDFSRVVSFYGSYEKMIGAFSFNTGSEYDLDEPFDPKSGQAYGKMTRHLAADKRFKDIGEIFRAPLEVRFEYFCELINSCLVSPTHAKKFLHIRNAGVEDKSVIFSG